MTDQQGELTSSWKYTLTGFGEFLEMRRVAFAEPMPPTHLCDVCGMLPSRTLLLPCDHVLCDSCRDQLPQGNDCCCPFDGSKFVDSDVHPMTIEWCELEQRRIVCSAGSQVCGFSGKLCELADHLTRCGGGKIKCCKCDRPVFRGHAVNHYRSCTGRLRTANAEAASTMANMEKNTRELMVSQAEFGCLKRAFALKMASLKLQLLEAQKKSSSDVASFERQLLEVQEKSSSDVASLERQLLEVQEKSSSDVARLERQLLEVQEKSSSDDQSAVTIAKKVTVIQGAHRAAPRGGVLITTCKFAGIYSDIGSLKEKGKELRISTDTYTLGGYTFKLECRFTKDGNIVNVAFALFLRDGEWDSYVDWPFSKKVTLVIMRPRNPAKDIRLHTNMKEHDIVKQPDPDSWNCSRFTDKINWKDIELQGYVDRGALYVNVEFE
ncbi:TNF receptor-associated factor 6 [Rhipicephalus sanguineus]|uniref:TNF receptor-associated factor 6 n=1 Tax=Rhipicephalus sanguineus TaxID=34632 RepID=UPI00189567BB|nr:TNF receptor-associated factor 6 [Rhipicephalus sanguineus]